jgi:hypothetical protein
MQLLRCSPSLDIEARKKATGEEALKIAIDTLLLNVSLEPPPILFPNTPICNPLSINLSPTILNQSLLTNFNTLAQGDGEPFNQTDPFRAPL